MDRSRLAAGSATADRRRHQRMGLGHRHRRAPWRVVGATWTASQPSLGTQTVPAVIGAVATAEVTIPQGLSLDVPSLFVTDLPPRPLPLGAQAVGGPGPPAPADSRSEIAATISTSSITDARAALAAAAVNAGLGTGLNGGSMLLLASELSAVLPESPNDRAAGHHGTTCTTAGTLTGHFKCHRRNRHLRRPVVWRHATEPAGDLQTSPETTIRR